MLNLEEYYPGDMAWKNFSDLFKEDTSSNISLRLLSSIDYKTDIARVIFGTLGAEHCLSWIDKKIPALNNTSVKENLHYGHDERVKSLLMRM